MKELEVKILEIDKKSTITKLEKLGAVKTFDDKIVAEFFLNQEKKKIRLRKKGDKNILTYKIKNIAQNINSNTEYEITFDNYENMVSILTNIGFEKYGSSKKHRISYTLGNIVFDLDKYDGIPRLIEVEAQSLSDLQNGVKLLGYQMKDTSTITEGKLKEFYKNKK